MLLFCCQLINLICKNDLNEKLFNKISYQLLLHYKFEKIMVCNICLNEVSEVSICPICGADLEIDNSLDNEWVHCYTTNDMIEAEMLKSQLLSAGIPIEILSQFDSARMLTVGELSLIKIYTPKPYFKEVRELIPELLKGNSDE